MAGPSAAGGVTGRRPRRQPRRTPITSSGSAVSANAVKPRRFRNTTVTSRRRLRSGSSASPVYNLVAWGTAAVMVVLTLLLIVTSLV